MYEYNSEDFTDEGEYRPAPGGGHGPGGKVWHGYQGYYSNKYYSDINYLYFLILQYYPYYPYDPYYDYYYDTY
jgi:hypothetical protein